MSRTPARLARAIGPLAIALAAIATPLAAHAAPAPADVATVVPHGAVGAYNLGNATLRSGSRGPAVAQLQQALNDKIGAGLKVDGRFGAGTRNAVRSFQQRNGLKADGIVGAATKRALNGAPAEPAPAAPAPAPAAPAAPAPSGDRCDVDTSQASAPKVLLIDGTGGPNAMTYLCDRQGDGSYRIVAKYDDGKVGRNGVAAPGAKRTGDGKTPSGTYALTQGFGKGGPAAEWRNGEWVNLDAGNCRIDDSTNNQLRCRSGRGGMGVTDPRAYELGQVIAYNQNPYVAYKGGSILLHANTGSGRTAGCVSETPQHLHEIFSWEGGQATQIQIRQ